MKQKELLAAISKHIPKDKSIIDVISYVLDISYPSAHRRINGNAKISIDEAVKLAQHFDLSLDLIFNTGDDNIISVKKTQITSDLKDLENYFQANVDTLAKLIKIKEASIVYCAKDLPISISQQIDILSKFKLFVWLKLLNPSSNKKNLKNFLIPTSVKKNYRVIAKYNSQVENIEIWDTTTINSTLKQILYYYSVNQITHEESLLICEELKNTILRLRERASPNSKFKLYYNELLLMGNKMIIKTPLKSTLYLQYTSMNYFKTNDPNTCEHTSQYINRLLESCKLINTSSDKEKDIFFNKMLDKVESLHDHINAQKVLDF